MTKLPFRGVWLPGEVFMDERLSQSSKMLWGIIHILSNERGCYASRSTLAEYMRCSERNVQLLIEELIVHGFVRRRPDGTLWDIWLEAGGEENFTGGVKEISPGGVKKTSPNSNKSIKDISDQDKGVLKDILSSFDDEIRTAWEEYIDLRKARRWPVSARWMLKQAQYLYPVIKSSPSGRDAALMGLRASIRNEWQSIHVKVVASTNRVAKTDSDHIKGF